MNAGREMDALVAEKVMAWTDVRVDERNRGLTVSGQMPDGHRTYVPHYSTDIAAAWTVVEKVRDTTDGDETWVSLLDEGADGWRCSIIYNLTSNDAPIVLADELADTAPLAICRAALAQDDTGVAA